jgi:pimeloyl-ACP methyl ester carboxylesterase
MNVEANGSRFAYIRRGRGEPLLLIQGMAGHHEMWGDWFLDLLEPHFDIVAFSHRGISTSSRADEPFTIADLADDAASVISAFGWQRAHIFGISLGGMVAQELALRHPSLVRTLTIGCSWAGGPGVTLAETARRMVDAMATRNAEHALKTGYEANLSQSFAADPENFARFARLSLAQRVPFPVVLMQWSAAQNHTSFERLPGLAAPTLVLHGTADAMMPAKNGSHIASLIPGSQLALLQGAGHLFWWEQPEEAANLLIKHAIG